MTREQIRNDLISLLKEAREDWDDSAAITDETGLFLDLGFESIDAVGLGSALEQHFGKVLPFPEFMSRAKEEDLSDITVGRLLDFLEVNLAPATGGKLAHEA
ncbi:MAG: acyl carrier protein [Bryobacterales bacterium]|nr:acyl carrier protein [Bryobacterales bacterium]